MCCWAWATSTLGLALGYEPSLALAPGFFSWYGAFIYMKVIGDSIMGFPGFSGVPTPLFELFGIVSASLLLNLIFKVVAGVVPLSFWLVLVFAIAGPQAIGKKVRGSDWKAPMPPASDLV